jgi:GntR family transcriptional repressor for pyruvate dehydrogenase complex
LTEAAHLSGKEVAMRKVKPIRRKKVSEEIVEEIKRLIEQGELPSDSKLPSEKELSDMFGVGRSSIHEALSMLAAARIIETRQGEGTFVRKVDLSDYIHPLALSIVAKKEQTLHLLETRKIIELGTVELAALRADQHDLKEMKKALLDFECQLEMGEDGVDADFAFHRAVAVASKNPILIQVIDNLSPVLKQSLNYTLYQNMGNLEKRRSVLQEHKEIFGSIEKRDAQGAVACMRQHLENVRKKLLELKE